MTRKNQQLTRYLGLGGLALGTVGVIVAAVAAVPTDTSALRDAVTVAGVRDHQLALQDIADANGGVRLAGTPGYDASVDYVVDLMQAAGYDVTIQEFAFNSFRPLGPSTLEQTAPAAVTYVEGTDFNVMDQSDPGDVTAPVTAVDINLSGNRASTSGCEIGDFDGFPAGHIALIQRGACAFKDKAENAAASGAVGAIIFNQGNPDATDDRFGLINGTLQASNTAGIPVVETTFARGEEWAETAGLEMHIVTDVFRGVVPTANVIADTPGGRDDRVVVVGAHLDSVAAGPGIQDNGSGSAAILEIALKMAEFGLEPRNKVRFAWWGAEEAGLVGSEFYVANLSQRELHQIVLNLNFDMIGSPNFVRFVYDGDGSDSPLFGPGPAGSDLIESVFLDYFAAQGLAVEPTAFDGRSDYGPFIAVGIPAGGLFTGAEGIKTDEQVAVYGGTAGDQYDPCYHLACDTFDNISLEVLEQNTGAAAHATWTFAMTIADLRGTGKAADRAAEAIPMDVLPFRGNHRPR